MAPAVSVVVPAHSRAERLRALLESLAAQEGGKGGVEGGSEGSGGTNGGIEGGGFEVVVVADGASADVLAVLESPPPGLVLRVERHLESRGPAAARNTGWRAATAPLVAFTDDDCVAAPGWLAALLGACRVDRSGADQVDTRVVVQGRVEPLPEERDRIGPFARTLWVREAGPFFQTANIMYPRALLQELGGFDEAYPHPAGEDTDLGWRAREAGAEVVFAPEALVWHAVHELGPGALVRDAPRWGSAVRIVKRHPQLREAFTHRYFWKAAHERLLLALAGLVLARRTRGASLVAVIPYLLAHRGEHPSTESMVRALPSHAAVDAAEVAAMARGSAREGTLLL